MEALLRDIRYGVRSLSKRPGFTVIALIALALGLGAKATMGLTFQLENEKPGSDQVAVLSYGLWQKRFGGDPAIVNKTVTLDGKKFEVMGVMPPDFSFPQAAELWVPINFDLSEDM